MLNAKPLVYLSGYLHFLYAPIECLLQCKSEILLNRRVLLWLWVTFQSTKCHIAISQRYSHSWRDLQNGYSMANDLAPKSVSLDIQDCKWLRNNKVLHRRWKDKYVSTQSICLLIHLFITSINPFICPSNCPYAPSCIHPSVCLSVCPTVPMHSSFCLSVCLSVCLSNHPHVPPIRLLISLCLSIHPASFPSIHLPIWCYVFDAMKEGVCLISHHPFNCLTCKWVAFSQKNLWTQVPHHHEMCV